MGQMDILCRIIWGEALIPVTPVAEPADFDQKVRVPGTAFLRTTPTPNGPQWKRKDYWRRALGDLFGAYGGICAYCASWTKRATKTSTPQDSSIDHFVPKSAVPTQAYEWDNFRLCRSRLNMRKDSNRDVLDPFSLAPGWFTLDFRTFFLVPKTNLHAFDRKRVKDTIDRLQLNDDNDYVNERIGAIREYCLGKATFAQLFNHYPFIAAEMRAQNFDTTFLPRMRVFFAAHP
ncbi:MAG: hypothetical protein Q8N95_06425 [Desulfobacterales bacterium]|nr:hypothetical protein [Desulfobacterales bacterium]